MNRKILLALASAAALCLATGTRANPDGAAGAVYTMTNAPTGNEIVIFDRANKGALAAAGSVATGGLGSGGGLDPLASQGSLVITSSKQWLLAVNAGSNEISVFRIGRHSLDLTDKVGSGGTFPISLAVFHDLVYVLNAGATPNITGFTLDHSGHLAPIAGSTRTLPGAIAAQVGFDPKGEALVITERAGNNLLVFLVDRDGAPSAAPVVNPSHGAGPFAFAFDGPGHLLVAEVGSNAVSSYDIANDGSLQLITGSVPNGQAATCWIETDGRYAYTGNPGTSSVSAYGVQPGHGFVRLLDGIAGSGSTPLDLASSQNGRFLYALDPAASGIGVFAVQSDGSLITQTPVNASLPIYAQGLAAR